MVDDAAVDVVEANVAVDDMTDVSCDTVDATAALVVLSSKPAAASDASETDCDVVLKIKKSEVSVLTIYKQNKSKMRGVYLFKVVLLLFFRL